MLRVIAALVLGFATELPLLRSPPSPPPPGPPMCLPKFGEALIAEAMKHEDKCAGALQALKEGKRAPEVVTCPCFKAIPKDEADTFKCYAVEGDGRMISEIAEFCRNSDPAEWSKPDYDGSEYCTHSPDYGCYETGGRPKCCSQPEAVRDCPEEKPLCDASDGSDYCTHSPDYGCYETGGRPKCCSKPEATRDCPEEKPECDTGGGGGGFCTYSPDATCYKTGGRPKCCSEPEATRDCPQKLPACDI